jgi:DNA-directed RNA polymerase specialized sigma24 family protein
MIWHCRFCRIDNVLCRRRQTVQHAKKNDIEKSLINVLVFEVHHRARMTREEYGQAYMVGFERTVRFLVSRGAQRDGAREAAQAAWARGWERVNQLRDDKLVTTWVNAIALNCYRSLLRTEVLAQPLAEQSGYTRSDGIKLDVDRVLRFCDAAERELLEQQIVGITTQEIARLHGVTETAIRIRLLRARRAAKARMERHAKRLRHENFVLMQCA